MPTHAHLRRAVLALLALCAAALTTPTAHAGPRENDLALPIGGKPGPLDAITDVAGVEVGQTTLISGSGKLVVGQGPVRAGVTVVLPRGKDNADPVFGAWFTLNGNGEMTGTTWLQEGGYLEGPVAITNTHSVGVVRDAIIQWELSRKTVLQPWWLPVVAETYDGMLNDISGFHVKPEHVLAALGRRQGRAGPGGRRSAAARAWCACISRAGSARPRGCCRSRRAATRSACWCSAISAAGKDLRIAGVPVGEAIPDLMPCIANGAPPSPANPRLKPCDAAARGAAGGRRLARAGARSSSWSATDAPLLPHQLKRLATRVALGVGRQGGFGGNGSGDIFLAFSTANPGRGRRRARRR